MYIITGGAGFIGSAFAAHLNGQGKHDILLVDELASTERWKNLRGLRFTDYVHKDEFLAQVQRDTLPQKIEAIIHLGACSATTELDVDYLMRNNYGYTRILAEYALKRKIRFIYASSAATYGSGTQGYRDDHDSLDSLRPLNPYGYSKQVFDQHAARKGWLNQIVGLKFFNVFGPNEYHKEDQRSVVHKAYQQIKREGLVRLFRSYDPRYKDGEQKRDFVYIKDCNAVMSWLLQNPKANGIFNLGTGSARTWVDLTNAVFAALSLKPNIEFIEMPDELKRHYQYFTEADMTKIQKAGCPVMFGSLEETIRDYVVNYLERENPYLEG